MSRTRQGKGTHLVGDGVEHRCEVAHVRAREDGSEHLALLLVRRSISEQQPRTDNEVPEAVGI